MPRSKSPPRIVFRPSTERWTLRDGRFETGWWKTKSEAEAALARYVRTKGPVRHIEDASPAVSRAIRGAKWRASSKGLPYSLTQEDVLERLARQGYRCAVTGMGFQLQWDGKGRRNPYGISIDRIEPCLGYQPENIRLVLTFVNLALNDFGEDVFWDVVHGIFADVPGRKPGTEEVGFR